MIVRWLVTPNLENPGTGRIGTPLGKNPRWNYITQIGGQAQAQTGGWGANASKCQRERHGGDDDLVDAAAWWFT